MFFRPAYDFQIERREDRALIPRWRDVRATARKSDTEQLSQNLAVVSRVTEQQFAALSPLEVEVRVVLPRETNTTVDLNVLTGTVEVGL